MQDDADLAAGQRIAAEDHHEDDADADDADHVSNFRGPGRAICGAADVTGPV